MRVLAIGNRYPPAASGGYERIWVGVDEALRRAGHDVRVLTTVGEADHAPPVHRELRWYWRDHDFPALSPRERLALERHNAEVVHRHLAEYGPDVVCFWGMGGMSLSVIEHVRRAGVRAVGIVGDAWMIYGFQVDAWQRACARLGRAAALLEPLARVPTRVNLGGAARWLFISRAVEAGARAHGHVLPRTAIAHPGVDVGRFAGRPRQDWAWRMAVVGRVESVKGVDTAIEALSHLPEQATLVIDGRGEKVYLAKMHELAERLGVSGRVTFRTSPSDAVADVYAAADVVLFPVNWPEPWGLVPIEAMSVGRLVVATGTGGSAEYLEDGYNCLLFPPGDAAALARAVERLAADAALRQELYEGGTATAARFPNAGFEAQVVQALEREVA